jgi:hypothetical protein
VREFKVSRHMEMSFGDCESPNHPATGKAGIASRLAVGHELPGLPEPGRYAAA